MNRLRLKDWLSLSGYRKEISDNQNVPNNLCKSLALSESKEWETLPWFEIGEAFFLLVEANQISIDFPILKDAPSRDEKSVPPWEYPNREWYFWVHLFSSKYGWNIEYISDLDIDDAVALMQEIELDRQLSKEWDYQLSEISYSYDAGSKKSRFVPLPRPKWMQKPVNIKATLRKIPKKFLPLGVIIKIDDENPNDK